MLAVRIEDVAYGTSSFDDVKVLSRANQGRLGFLQWEAFSEAASTGRLTGAWIEDKLVGYCLYRLRKSDRSISLTHVCVDASSRGHGVAQQLVEFVAQRHGAASAIVVTCRADYPAAKLWPTVQFARVGSTQGKGAGGTVLERWVRLLSDNLFTLQPSERAVVVVDTDVIRDISEPRSEFQPSLALEDDWVDEVAELVTVPNVETEISRAADTVASLQGACGRFRQLTPASASVDAARRSIEEANISAAVGSNDRLNIAQAAGGDADYFVTRDQALLGNASEFLRAVSLTVLSPADLVLRLHADLNADDFRPTALVRTPIQLTSSEALPPTQALASLVDHEVGEAARALRRLLEESAASAGGVGRVVVASESNHPVAVVAERFIASDRRLEVTAVRVATDRDRYAFARQLVHLTREHCLELGGDRVTMIGHTPEYVARALRDEGFVYGDDGWRADCDRAVLTARDRLPDSTAGITVGELTTSEVSRIERERWPLKLFGGNVATYVVPIRPAWAQALFDHDPPQGLLLERDRRLGLARQHVYYKSSAAFIEAPARILWFVSTDDPNGGVRACSWLDGVETDRPGTLYQRFGDHGVFSRRDIEDAAGQRGQATVLSFSRTELFREHLTLRRCRELSADFQTSGFLTTTRAVSEHVFVDFYREGLGLI
jgi:predicted GNAT family acetyltransferase